MQTLFTAKFMQFNCGCYKKEKGKLKSMVLKGRGEITYQDILDSEIPLKDKYWFFCKKVFSKEQNQQISIIVAETVLPIYEKKYPDNKAPREAIEAAKLYLSGHISLEQLLRARRAVDAAAAEGVDAATWATDATYAATWDADDVYKVKLTEILSNFIKENN